MPSYSYSTPAAMPSYSYSTPAAMPPYSYTIPATVPTYPTPIFPTSWIGDREKLDVWDVVQQTFSILSHTLPAGMNAEPWLDQMGSLVGKSGGEFRTVLQYWLNDLLKTCTIGTPPLTNEARIMYLKSLWYHEIAYHHLRAPGSFPTLDFFPIHFITPEIARRIHTEEDLVTRVIARSFGSLVVNRFAAKSKPFGDRELACLSTILFTKQRKAIHQHFKPGVVQLVNMVSLASGELSSFVTDTVPSDVQHIVRQTIGTLAQALPAELKVELQLDQADALMNVPDSSIKSIIVSFLRDLLKTCTLRTLPLPEEVRTCCLQMCLYSMWDLGQVLHRLGDSQPFPPELLDLAGLEITRLIRTEKDQASRVLGRCVEALVVSNLAARIKSHTDSTVQISDEALTYLSAILGTESRDLRLLLGRPGAVELANMVSLIFSEIDSLFSDTIPSDVLDMIQQTYGILSPTLPAELNAEMMNLTDGQCEVIL